jgi:Tfp pilus assembly protein PilF
MTAIEPTIPHLNSMGYVHHAVALFKSTDFLRSYDNIEKAIKLDPSNAIAWLIKASLCRKLNQSDLATDCFLKALELDPGNADAWGNYANFLHQEKRENFQKIQSCYQKALNLAQGNAVIWNNYGFFCNDHHQIVEANEAFKNAVTFDPGSENYWVDYGISHFQLNQNAQAIACYERALDIEPSSYKAKYNLSLALLRIGQYELAWPLYEHRFDIGSRLTRQFEHIPRLRNIDDHVGQSTLIWAEQGFGDTLQFVRFLRYFDTKKSRITLFCQEELRTLLGFNFPKINVISEVEVSAYFDLQIPLVGLPAILNHSNNLLNNSLPYLFNRPIRTLPQSMLLNRLQKKRPQIALCCSGNPRHRDDYYRSIAMHHFDFLNDFGDVLLFQQDIRETDLQYFHGSEFHFLGPALKTFDDSAVLLEGCDVVISVDTALVHLAGALGLPAYCLLSLNSDWRWGVGAKSSPYKSVIPLAQSSLGDWERVFIELKSMLEKRSWIKRGG